MKIQADAMMPKSAAASELLKSLANPHRLMILCQIFQGERSVSDLAAALELRVSTMSQHLALLRRSNLVATRRERQVVYYRIADPDAQRILETLFAIYCEAPAGSEANDDHAASSVATSPSLPDRKHP